MCIKFAICLKISLKDKTCSRLLQLQKGVPNAKSCSKVAEHKPKRVRYDYDYDRLC